MASELRPGLGQKSAIFLLLVGCGSEEARHESNGSGGNAGGGAAGSAGVGGGASGSNGDAAAGARGGSGATGGAVSDAAPAGDGGDPAPGGYGTRQELIEANSEMAVAEVNGKIYVIGGYPASREVQATVQVFDPQANSWDYGTPLPIPIHHPVAVGALGKLYSLGGQLTSGDTNRTLVFDPATGGAWQDLSPMPTARGAGAGALIGDKIYVAGGRPPAGNAFEVYDISDNAWTSLPDLPQTFPERNHLAATAIGGKVYVAGGRYNGGSFSDPRTDSLDVFDPALGSWQSRKPMLRPRGGVNGIAAFGCFFVWGGEGDAIGEPNNVYPDHDVYDPRSDTWTALARLPVPVHGVTGAAFLDGLIYMPGGGTRQGGSSGSTIFQVYRPATRCE